jgi:hypothetical protein
MLFLHHVETKKPAFGQREAGALPWPGRRDAMQIQISQGTPRPFMRYQ